MYLRGFTSNLIFHILPVILLAVIINIPKFLECRVRSPGFLILVISNIYLQIGYYFDVEANMTKSFVTVTELRMNKHYSLYYQNLAR